MTRRAATPNPSTGLVTRHVGMCPVCEATQKLTTDAIDGVQGGELKMVHHAFTREGDGSGIQGGCFAVGAAPYEVSCAATKAYRTMVQQKLDGALAYLARLENGEIETLTVYEWSCTEGRKVPRTYTKANTSFNMVLNQEISAQKSRVRGLTDEVARVTALIIEWRPQPLRTVEEVEGAKAAEKAAIKADKAAAKAAKVAAKIASYQKRLDSAVAKRKPAIIAEIFESAFRYGREDLNLSKTEALKPLQRDHVFAAFGLNLTENQYDRYNSAVLDTMTSHRFEWTTNKCPWPSTLG